MILKIAKYSIVADFKAQIDGSIVYTHPAKNSFPEFLTSLYRSFPIQYPKFFKMDNLSKTGFLAVELCLKDSLAVKDESNFNTAIFMLCSSSSLDTDIDFQNTIQPAEYFPSPKVFVYTLSNIVMGEIAIRHKIFGENTCFISESFACQSVLDYIYQSFAETEIENAIILWDDYLDGKGESVALLVEKEKDENIDKMNFNVESINNIIK